MRKALAIIGMVQALIALAPILAEAAGPMGMAPSRGQSHQFSQNPQFNRSNQFNQSFHGHPFPNYYPNFNRSNFYRYRYHRPNYYRPYYYYPYYSSYSSSYYSAPPAYAPQQNYSNYSGAPSGYGAPQGYLDMAPAPQIEREVFFPEGRYVLLGDGVVAPFHWVWVPNPPTAPPYDTQDQR
jgi:hypothetical protein